MTLHELLLAMEPIDWIMLGIVGISFIGACWVMKNQKNNIS